MRLRTILSASKVPDCLGLAFVNNRRYDMDAYVKGLIIECDGDEAVLHELIEDELAKNLANIVEYDARYLRYVLRSWAKVVKWVHWFAFWKGVRGWLGQRVASVR